MNKSVLRVAVLALSLASVKLHCQQPLIGSWQVWPVIQLKSFFADEDWWRGRYGLDLYLEDVHALGLALSTFSLRYRSIFDGVERLSTDGGDARPVRVLGNFQLTELGVSIPIFAGLYLRNKVEVLIGRMNSSYSFDHHVFLRPDTISGLPSSNCLEAECGINWGFDDAEPWAKADGTIALFLGISKSAGLTIVPSLSLASCLVNMPVSRRPMIAIDPGISTFRDFDSWPESWAQGRWRAQGALQTRIRIAEPTIGPNQMRDPENKSEYIDRANALHAVLTVGYSCVGDEFPHASAGWSFGGIGLMLDELRAGRSIHYSSIAFFVRPDSIGGNLQWSLVGSIIIDPLDVKKWLY